MFLLGISVNCLVVDDIFTYIKLYLQYLDFFSLFILMIMFYK